MLTSLGRPGSPELLELLASGHPPAFATDSRDRIVFCNDGAAAILGHRADELIGRRCHDVLAGRDVFGNRYCYANCPVRAGVQAQEEIASFELQVAANGNGSRTVGVTILRIPSLRPDLFTLVHVLRPIEEGSRLAWLMARLRPCDTGVTAQPLTSEAPLTQREREILHHVAEGLPNKQIAARLRLSTATVRNHVHHILDKLQVHSKLQAVSLAFQRGWVRRDATADR